ncbi:MAG: ligase-associated DNA damage response endonuclease PdeM [Imperialibacter sp.]|uniref:ligase-associated DNA damage response endonuclease PdeM n=1 Tax=Imperialibacter sp. TaxID=2038411 RepID=UPI0032ED8B89
MKDSLEFTLLEQSLVLSIHKSIFWKEQECLIVSDLHLGKAGHFRKAGIPISSKIHTEDLDRLDLLLNKYQPKRLIMLGDLFHSDKNNEWEAFSDWRSQYQNLKITLTLGNHDIIETVNYKKINVTVVDELLLAPFFMSHHPTENANGYNLAGHLHPGISLQGKARQGVRIPCFYFGQKGALMPAFGNFTGYVAISPGKQDKVFAVTPTSVITIQ